MVSKYVCPVVLPSLCLFIFFHTEDGTGSPTKSNLIRFSISDLTINYHRTCCTGALKLNYDPSQLSLPVCYDLFIQIVDLMFAHNLFFDKPQWTLYTSRDEN